MIPVPENILYYTKDPKTLRYSTFPLKTGSGFSSLTNFFLLDNTKKKLYNNVPQMFKFNPKTRFLKYLISSSWCNFFNVNVSDF